MFSPKKLKARRQELGLTQSTLAKQLSISRMSYSNWEAGKTKPNQKNLLALADLLNVHVHYFESEYEIVEKYLKLNELNKIKLDQYADKLLSKQTLPLFSVRVLSDIPLSAGRGSSYYDEFETTEVFTDKEYHYDIAAWISGNSMEPQYLNGEVALIRETGFDYDRAVYAVVWNSQTFIKKVYRGKEGLRLVSINKDYKDIHIPYDENPRIVGKIVGNFMSLEV